jgi:hypothetical protein
MSAEDLRRMHDKRAAALQERISEPGTTLPTEDEIAARVKQARESGKGLTRYDGEAVIAWWDEEMV